MSARRDERFVKPGELPYKLAIECATVAQGLAARASRRAWEARKEEKKLQETCRCISSDFCSAPLSALPCY